MSAHPDTSFFVFEKADAVL